MTLAKNGLQALGARCEAQGLTQQMLKTFVETGGCDTLDTTPIVNQIRTHNSARGNVFPERPRIVVPLQGMTSFAQALSIMKQANTLQPELVSDALRKKYSKGDLAKLAVVPFTEEILNARAMDYNLVAGYKISINGLRGCEAVLESSVPLFYSSCTWCAGQPFADKRVAVRWSLIRCSPIENSLNLTFKDQKLLIPAGEVVPCARDVVFTAMVKFCATGTRMLEQKYVRCVDVSSGGYRVYVGLFDQSGLDIATTTGTMPTVISASALSGILDL